MQLEERLQGRTKKLKVSLWKRECDHPISRHQVFTLKDIFRVVFLSWRYCKCLENLLSVWDCDLYLTYFRIASFCQIHLWCSDHSNHITNQLLVSSRIFLYDLCRHTMAQLFSFIYYFLTFEVEIFQKLFFGSMLWFFSSHHSMTFLFIVKMHNDLFITLFNIL